MDLFTPIVPPDQDTMQQDESVTGLMRTLLGSDPDTLDCHAAAEIVVMLVKQLDPTLDLTDMAGWKIVDDLSVGAQELSEEVGLEINPTNRELGSATARVVHTEKGSIVLVESSLFRNLITGPEGDATLAINVLHHELCHVHDAEVRKRMPWWQGKVGDDLRMRVLLPPLVRLFDEYSANRRSIKTIPSWFEKAQTKLLAREWKNIRNTVSAAVQCYHARQDIHRLMAEVGRAGASNLAKRL